MAASEIRVYDATITAGTTEAAPMTQQLVMPPREVDWIRVRIPPGPAGLMGFRLTQGGNTIIPYDSAAWIIADDEIMTWPVTGMNNSGYWLVEGYNADTLDHTIYIQFGVSIPGAGDSAPALIPAEQLNPT